MLVVMAHGMIEGTKLLSTALGALEYKGMSTEEAMDHVFLLGSDMMPLFGLQRNAVSARKAALLHEAAHSTVFDCSLSCIPGIRQELTGAQSSQLIDRESPMMSPLFVDLANGTLSIERLRTGLGYNFVPASDDRPYFFQYDRRIPGIVVGVFLLALGVLVMAVYGPAKGFAAVEPVSWWLPGFFAAIGLGYVIVELGMIQRIGFYLGDPSRTLAVLLAALLVGTGIGSLVSGRSKGRTATFGGAATAVGIMTLLPTLRWIFTSVDDAALVVQEAVAAAILLGLGVPMGMMFPVGLRMGVERWGRGTVPWMWAVNGSASVAGGALAVGIGMDIGNSGSLVAGASMYVVAAVAAVRLTKGGR